MDINLLVSLWSECNDKERCNSTTRKIAIYMELNGENTFKSICLS